MAGDEEEKVVPEKGRFKSMLFSLWAGADGGKKKKDEPSDMADELETEEAGEESPEEVAKEKDDNLVPVKNNQLYELYQLQNGLPPHEEGNENAVFHLSVFMAENAVPDAQQRNFLKGLGREAAARFSKTKLPEEVPVEAAVSVFVAPDRMSAGIFVFPPLFEGEEVQPENIEVALAAKGVTYGLKKDVLDKILQNKQYFTFFVVAEGLPPENGKDGEVIDHYRRNTEIQLTVKDDNTIDYKDLNWLQTVVVGDVICDVIPPTKATPGMNINGAEVKGRDGRKANAPKGNGTNMNEQDTQLIATIDGVLSFISQRFRVDPLLIIKGDVDTAVGNLDVIGDVLINGDIQEGFAVEATGNITVQGMIEGATVVAGGHVQVGRGMNGNSQGSIEAKGDVRCKFIENGTVNASGKIICDTIINSTVSSDQAIEVKSGRGAIIGGAISALERIDALSIGNQSNRNMSITLGSTAYFLKEKYELEEKRKEVADEIDDLVKNINYLSGFRGSGNPASAKAVEDMKLKLTVQKMQLANLDRRIAVMEQKQADNSQCRLRAEVVYPPVQITIGSFTKNLREVSYNALVYLKEGEIHVGNV